MGSSEKVTISDPSTLVMPSPPLIRVMNPPKAAAVADTYVTKCNGWSESMVSRDDAMRASIKENVK